MTIPNLIANYQKKVWVTQLKKDVNFVLNGYNKILIEEGVDNLYDTDLICTGPNGSYYVCPDKLYEYWKLNQVSTDSLFHKLITTMEPENDIKSFLLNDGSCIAISKEITNMTDFKFSTISRVIPIYIDVNCDKKPNEAGRDRFQVYLDLNNQIVLQHYNIAPLCSPVTHQEWLEFVGGDEEVLKEIFKELKENNFNLSCFAKIFIDGWQMNY